MQAEAPAVHPKAHGPDIHHLQGERLGAHHRERTSCTGSRSAERGQHAPSQVEDLPLPGRASHPTGHQCARVRVLLRAHGGRAHEGFSALKLREERAASRCVKSAQRVANDRISHARRKDQNELLHSVRGDSQSVCVIKRSAAHDASGCQTRSMRQMRVRMNLFQTMQQVKRRTVGGKKVAPL